MYIPIYWAMPNRLKLLIEKKRQKKINKMKVKHFEIIKS